MSNRRDRKWKIDSNTTIHSGERHAEKQNDGGNHTTSASRVYNFGNESNEGEEHKHTRRFSWVRIR